ncbi:TonB-dependent receptor [Aggregicoccus sp. 17bor-14]|uniref:TonB-dependent receptor n=1 Tax=Myxococcaceae TaxID=31 RepID=UPI00129C8533|nr:MULTISPECIES: TonB-dependent receptor [Myxococcaceae]MBF5043231.1 TonB-dependent receptor [Simulacricoccus sp. 17bor-14]MRI88988.1 TonB-dependent receptor [Aggregicoccus sp. 17bor-14]
MKPSRVLRATGAFLAAALLYGPAALAQTGVITGTVSDSATHKPAPDVVVTATSPNLQGEQVVVTDATGQYRIPQLPPGNYTLRFEKEQFQPYSRTAIQLRVDRTIRVNVELLPTGLTEEILVQGTAPTVDVGSTSTGVNVGADFVRHIAVVAPSGKGGAARSFESLADIAPGANTDTYGVSLSGTTSPENAFVIDGLSVNDPGFGTLGTPLSVEFIQDVNVITGGYMPEYGRATGGVLNAVTKSGSNEFHGSVFANFTPGSLEGTATPVVSQGSAISSTSSLHALGDFGAELGGPILKDKLWFYAGIAPSFTRYDVERGINARVSCAAGSAGCVGGDPADGTPGAQQDENGFYVVNRVEGTTTHRFADQRAVQYIGKLTYLVNQDHNISLSVYGSPNRSGSASAYALANQSGQPAIAVQGQFDSLGTRNSNSAMDMALKTASSFMDKRLLVDATLGWHHQAVSVLPVDGSHIGDSSGLASRPGVQFRPNGGRSVTDFEFQDDAAVRAACTGPGGQLLCPVTTYNAGGTTAQLSDDTLDRYQGKAVGTFLANAAGRHVFKAGVDVEALRYDRLKALAGGAFLRESLNSGANFTEFRNFGYLTAPGAFERQASVNAISTSNTVGGFLQDSWSVLDLFTINAGVRYDQQRMYGDDDLLALNLGNQWSPRVGVLYDFTQQGRSKVYANYARFYEQVPLDLADRQFPGERQVSIAHRKTLRGSGAANCNLSVNDLSASTGACLDTSNLAGLTPLSGDNDPNSFLLPVGGVRSPVDPDLKPQSSDEFVAGAEYEVIANGRVGASYTRRYMNAIIEDMSRDDGNTYFIGNPSRGIARDFPAATRDYSAVTVFFDKTFADRWLAQVSYTWSKLEGNYAGLFRPEDGQLDPNINADFDLVSLLPNRTGPLPGDRTHNLKVFAAKEFLVSNNVSFNLGATYRGRSGTPYSYLGAFPGYGNGQAFLLERGAAGRTPWRNDIDGRVGLNYKLSENNLVTVGVDVFNLFNFQQATLVDENYTFGNPQPCVNTTTDARECLLGQVNPDADVPGEKFTEADINPNFGKATQYQAPRSIRFGAKVTF